MASGKEASPEANFVWQAWDFTKRLRCDRIESKEQGKGQTMKILETPFIAAIRENHALEHATIHVLTQRNPYLHLVGRTTPRGFLIYGEVETELVAEAASEALVRLQGGERGLAVHPRCGTNIATAGVLAGLSAFAVTSVRSKSRLARLPQILLATTAAIIVAQPLGLALQEYLTTSPRVERVRIEKITRQVMGKITAHRVDLGRE
jgi:hypothetical protein